MLFFGKIDNAHSQDGLRFRHAQKPRPGAASAATNLYVILSVFAWTQRCAPRHYSIQCRRRTCPEHRDLSRLSGPVRSIGACPDYRESVP
ncbi:MAG: hypothetical protein U5R06_04100 [candidate division KSB1 bacterium]|nr:hypothetical protein [candidate division KSB1 bacterium]